MFSKGIVIQINKRIPLSLLRAHFYTGQTRMYALRGRQPGHLNVRAALRHFVPDKGLHPLRHYAAILTHLPMENDFSNHSPSASLKIPYRYIDRLLKNVGGLFLSNTKEVI